LRLARRVAEATGDREVILVLVEGKAASPLAAPTMARWATGWTCSRRPRRIASMCRTGSDWAAMATTPCTLAVCSAPGTGGHAARRIGPEGIVLTPRGQGANTRHINNIAMEAEDWCDSLLVTEVFTPAGNWSSYPPHRHDEDDFPRMTYLEETYYHRLNPAQGYGLQRVYTEDGSLDETMAVRNHDVVLVPRAITPAACPMATRCITSTSWRDRSANGASRTTPTTTGSIRRDNPTA
jgi:5-deoxy-glucuronate isomerase